MEYFFNFDKMDYLHGNRPDGCILCLVRDKSPLVNKLIVFETDYTIVSLNLYPYNPGHLLVFPKKHILDIRELSSKEEKDSNDVTKLCLNVLDDVFKPSAYNIGYNMGRPAGASIEHIHKHIVPRYPSEIGIMEIVSGHRLLVQNPLDTQKLLIEAFKKY